MVKEGASPGLDTVVLYARRREEDSRRQRTMTQGTERTKGVGFSSPTCLRVTCSLLVPLLGAAMENV